MIYGLFFVLKIAGHAHISVAVNSKTEQTADNLRLFNLNIYLCPEL